VKGDRVNGTASSSAFADRDGVLRRFEQLQRGLASQWRLIASLNHEPHSVVVVPSMSLAVDVPDSILRAYEERMLFLLLLLRQARTRVVYVTSQPVLPEIIDYYLSLLPGIIPSQARKRLLMVPVLDGSSRPLSEKLLARPRALERLRALIPDPARCHLIPFITTELEQELAVRLGIPMYAADPRFFPFGTKSGGRTLFAQEGVPHPLGFENLHTQEDLVGALARLRAARPGLAAAVVKLDDAVSGQGNATVDLSGLPAAGAPEEQGRLRDRLLAMRLEAEDTEVDAYLARFAKEGGVVEERLAGESFASPSVQLRVTPLGEVQLLSTHDQLLGGASGQSYLGCVFPACPDYAPAISRLAARVGERLAREGVIGRFALDFVTVRDASGGWQAHAIEINLRKGGTTHPYLTLEFLTDGRYDAETGRFLAPSGREKHYVASDHVESEAFRTLVPEDLFELAMLRGLHFNQSTQTGVVFHMISSVTERGRFGLTAVGDSREQANEIFDRARRDLEAEARVAGS
jgi:PGM1 C-terminal domain